MGVKRVKLMRGVEAERFFATPVQGEPIMTTDELKLYLGNGNKAGGFMVNADNTIAVWPDQTDATKKLSLAWWIAYFNGNEATIRIHRGTHEVLDDMTIPKNICLKFDKGAIIKVADTKTLTINGAIEAGLWQIFDGDGIVTGNIKCTYIYPEWFGAVADNMTDSTDGLQKAININIPVKLSKGTYLISIPLQVIDNTNIIGAGQRTTILKSLVSTTGVFKAAGIATSARTQQIVMKDFLISCTNEMTDALIDLSGASYVTLENIQLTNTTGTNNTGIAIKFIVINSFNGYWRILNCRTIGFNYGIYGACNDIEIQGGMYNSSTTYGIYINKGDCVNITGCEASGNNVGGMYLDGKGITVENCWFEQNGGKPSNEGQSLYPKNDIVFGENSKHIDAHACRFQLGSNTDYVKKVYHGTLNDFGIDYSMKGIGFNFTNPTALAKNGYFQLKNADGVPYGWNVSGATCSAIPDIDAIPIGYGNGVRITSNVEAYGKIYQKVLSPEEVQMYKGRWLTCTFYARFSSEDVSLAAGLSESQNFGNEPPMGITKCNIFKKFTQYYLIRGTESNGIFMGALINSTSAENIADLVGFSCCFGQTAYDAHDKPVSTCGGSIWSQDFFIGGKRHGFRDTKPSTNKSEEFPQEWGKGDIVWNTNPSAGGYIGWVCSNAGSYYTWKGFGIIES